MRFIAASAQLRGPKAERIIRESLSRVGGKTRTQVRRALRQQAGYKSAAVVNKRTRSYMPSSFEYVIVGTGKGVPIQEVKGVRAGKARSGTWRDQPRTAKGRFGRIRGRERGKVTSRAWNVAHRYKRSFRHEGKGLVARLPGESRALRKLFGPSVAKEIVKDQALDAFHRTGPQELARILPAKIARLLP